MLNDRARANGNKKNSNSGTTRYFINKTINRHRCAKAGVFCFPPQFHFSNLQWPRMHLRLSFRPSCCCPALISAASGASRQRALACLTLPRATQRQTGRVRIDSAFGRSDLRRVSLGQTFEQALSHSHSRSVGRRRAVRKNPELVSKRARASPPHLGHVASHLAREGSPRKTAVINIPFGGEGRSWICEGEWEREGV